MAFSGHKSDEFEIVDYQEVKCTPDNLATIQKWLQRTNYSGESSQFLRLLSLREPETCRWICETSQFQQWRNSKQCGSLWIKGFPGAGKSVIAASLVEYLRCTKGVPILFFFFNNTIESNQKPRNLIQDWLSQLLPYSPRLQALLETLCKHPISNFSDEQLWEYLITGLTSVEKAYCIVDALDEVDRGNSDAFHQRLNQLTTFRPASVKLLMTSRTDADSHPDIMEPLMVCVSSERDLVEKDITLFVSRALTRAIPSPDQVHIRDSLITTNAAKSRGRFLYARLLVVQIISQLASKEVVDLERLANSFPIHIEEMYNSILLQKSHTPLHPRLGTAIHTFLFECVIHSPRPMRLNELADAIDNVLVPKFLDSDTASLIGWDSKQVVETICAPLLEILEDGTVQVIHQSFTEFLLDPGREKSEHGSHSQFPVLTPAMAHRHMVEICLKYQGSGCLQHSYLEPRFEQRCDAECDHGSWPCPRPLVETDPYQYQDAQLRHPFLKYAVTNWAWHASHYDIEDNDFYHLVSEFLDPNNQDFQRWLLLEWGLQYPITESQIPSVLHVAAFAGMSEYGGSLLRQGHNVEALDSTERTPLHWAATKGHTKFVSLLLRNGANPNPTDAYGVKPLHEAARHNHANIVQLLLQAGVDPCTLKTRENHRRRPKGGEIVTIGETALEYVCQLGHTQTILTMLPFLDHKMLEQMLCNCCQFGQPGATAAILENSSVSPNARFEGATALYLATIAENITCVRLLLAKGADPNLPSEWRPTPKIYGEIKSTDECLVPIHRLVSWNSFNNNVCQSIFRSLVEAGANLEAKAKSSETTFLLLFGPGYLPAVKCFLESGANISAVGETTLYRGTDTTRGILQRLLEGSKDVDVLKLLLDNGADIHVKDRNGNNALHMALSCHTIPGNVDGLINVLLDHGVEAHATNNAGLTPLELAMKNPSCSLRTLEMLLNACLDSTVFQRCLSLIDNRPKEESDKIFQMLLSAGASLKYRDKSGATPLLKSAHSTNLFETFLSHGANIHAVDNDGRGILHHYVQRGDSIERLRSLVQLGLDPMAVDNDGNTLLHLAVGLEANDYKKPNIPFIEQILDLGVAPNSKNKFGSTAMHIHVKNRQSWNFSNIRMNTPLLDLLQKSSQFDINSQDNEGLTLLHLATLLSEYEVAQILGAGVDPTILDKDGRNALHLACTARKSSIVGLLVSKLERESLNIADYFQRTALHDACTSGQPESVYSLIRAGANVNLKDSNGRTPLHACAEFVLDEYRPHVHKSFYGFGLASHAPTTTEVPWNLSERQKQSQFDENDILRVGCVVIALLEAGADINWLDKSGKTPLNLSISLECLDMTAILQCVHSNTEKSLDLEKIDTELRIKMKSRQDSGEESQNSFNLAMKEVLETPSAYLSHLTLSDMDCIIAQYENDDTLPFYDKPSLIKVAAELGITEIVDRLRESVRFYDRAPPLRPSTEGSQDIIPILQYACGRSFPNLKMLETLIEKCAVDVNALSRQSTSLYPSHQSEKGDIKRAALHCLASADYFWQLEAIHFLVQHGADIDIRNEKGETPLHIASSGPVQDNLGNNNGFWKVECVKALLELGADPNACCDDGLTPLHKAGASAEIIALLLQNGANISAGRVSPIFFAIREQSLEGLRILLDAGCNCNASTDSFSKTPDIIDQFQTQTALFIASSGTDLNYNTADSVPLIKLLIERGAHVNAPLNNQETLIHYIFEHGEYESVCAFLDCHDKIDFNVRDQRGRNVLLAACNWTGIAPGYQTKSDLAKEQFPILRLLDHGTDVLAVSNDGRNALHHLLDNPDIEQDTILEFLNREPEACRTLMKQRDRDGFLPFDSAVRLLRPEVCLKLVSMGANLLDTDPTGTTVLHHIVRQYLRVRHPSRKAFAFQNYSSEHYESCLKLWNTFLDLGGSINARDSTGSPPLFAYLSSPPSDMLQPPLDFCCHLENFSRLFDREDLDVNIRNNEGESALHIIAKREKSHYAVESHDARLFDFFVKGLKGSNGLDPLARDIHGRTALDIAAAIGKTDILELFRPT